MKKYLLFYFFIFLGLSAQSQVLISLIFGDKLNTPALEFGLEGGVSWSHISGMESDVYLRNWNLGFYFDMRIKNQWFFYTGVLVKATLGLSELEENDLNFLEARTYPDPGSYAQKINYFYVPALIKYKFKNRIYVMAGPQFGLRTKAWIEYDTKEDEFEGIVKQTNSDDLSRLDVGIVGGAGFRITDRMTSWSIGIKYYYGFVDVYKEKSGTKNSAILLNANIPIGAGAKAKEKSAQKVADKKEKKEAKQAKKEAKKKAKE